MTLWTTAHQAPLFRDSPGKSNTGGHALTIGDLPNPRIKLVSLMPPVLAALYHYTWEALDTLVMPGKISDSRFSRAPTSLGLP